MVISYQLLFIVISSVIFIFIRDRTFKYYALYNFTLIIYILSRYNVIYDGFVRELSYSIGLEKAEILTRILTFFIQVVFYNLYVIFVLYFLDLHRHTKNYFKKIILLLRVLTVVFFFSGIICYYYQTPEFFIKLFSFIYIPSIIALFVPSVLRVIKFTGNHKYYLIVGVSIFILCGLTAFAGSYIPSLGIKSPISFFYIGLIIETIFFSLGLAYKIKILSEERNRIRNSITHHKYKQHISKIQGLIEGEEKEKNRIAEELHDGITGDLSAIKINLARLKQHDDQLEHFKIIDDVSRIVDKAHIHIREISHNLSPHSIVNYGLIVSVETYCKSIEKLYEIKCPFTYIGDPLNVKISTETHLYRIVQELINNIVKHSEANSAAVSISYHTPILILTISDSGKGFTCTGHSHGIGFNNIESRIKILNGKFTKEKTKIGCAFSIKIDTDKIPDQKPSKVEF